MSLVTGCGQDGKRRNSSASTGSGGRCKDQEKGMHDAFGLRGLAFPSTSSYASVQVPPYIGLDRRECDEPGFMPRVLYTWLAMLMRNRDRSNNIMIFHRDVHMAAKVAALDDPLQVCSLQLTKSKRADWPRSYHHEVTQRVHAGPYSFFPLAFIFRTRTKIFGLSSGMSPPSKLSRTR